MRRFAQNVANNRYYRIGFYDINETPPKVSVKVDSATAASFNNETFEISNQIDAVLESKYKENPYIKDMIRAGKLDYTQIED